MLKILLIFAMALQAWGQNRPGELERYRDAIYPHSAQMPLLERELKVLKNVIENMPHKSCSEEIDSLKNHLPQFIFHTKIYKDVPSYTYMAFQSMMFRIHKLALCDLELSQLLTVQARKIKSYYKKRKIHPGEFAIQKVHHFLNRYKTFFYQGSVDPKDSLALICFERLITPTYYKGDKRRLKGNFLALSKHLGFPDHFFFKPIIKEFSKISYHAVIPYICSYDTIGL